MDPLTQHGEHDAGRHEAMPRWGRELWDAVWHLRAQYDRNEDRLDKMETTMADQQAEIDTDVAAIGSAVTSIETEIAALKAAQPQLNLAALDAAVAGLAAVVPAPAPTPAPSPAPSPTPSPAPTPAPSPTPAA